MIIRSTSELRTNYKEISNYCHESKEPVYITKNGHGDLVVLDIDIYEELINKCKNI